MADRASNSTLTQPLNGISGVQPAAGNLTLTQALMAFRQLPGIRAQADRDGGLQVWQVGQGRQDVHLGRIGKRQLARWSATGDESRLLQLTDEWVTERRRVKLGSGQIAGAGNPRKKIKG